MKFSINPPKGFLGWTIYVIIGKFLLDIIRWCWQRRGSSNETQKDMEEIRKALSEQPTKEDIRDIVEKVCQNFVSKDLFEERISRIKEEIIHDYDIKFIKIENIAKEQKREATGMKQQLRQVFEPMIKEYHKINNKSKIKKQISKEVKSILENYEA